MNEWIEGSDSKASVVSVWTPWGEQKVLRSDNRSAALRRAAARIRGSEEPMGASLSDAALGNS